MHSSAVVSVRCFTQGGLGGVSGSGGVGLGGGGGGLGSGGSAGSSDPAAITADVEGVVNKMCFRRVMWTKWVVDTECLLDGERVGGMGRGCTRHHDRAFCRRRKTTDPTLLRADADNPARSTSCLHRTRLEEMGGRRNGQITKRSTGWMTRERPRVCRPDGREPDNRGDVSARAKKSHAPPPPTPPGNPCQGRQPMRKMNQFWATPKSHGTIRLGSRVLPSLFIHTRTHPKPTANSDFVWVTIVHFIFFFFFSS